MFLVLLQLVSKRGSSNTTWHCLHTHLIKFNGAQVWQKQTVFWLCVNVNECVSSCKFVIDPFGIIFRKWNMEAWSRGKWCMDIREINYTLLYFKEMFNRHLFLHWSEHLSSHHLWWLIFDWWSLAIQADFFSFYETQSDVNSQFELSFALKLPRIPPGSLIFLSDDWQKVFLLRAAAKTEYGQEKLTEKQKVKVLAI